MRCAELALALLVAVPAAAGRRDACLVAWHVDGGTPRGRATVAVCPDGDAACDTDGAADGACTFAVSLCLNAPVAGCAPGTVGDVALRGPVATPLAAALDALPRPITATGVCTAPVPVRVALGRRGRRTVAGRALARDAAAGRRGRARVRLVCRRRPPGTAAPRAVVVTTDFETGVLTTLHVEPPRTPARLAPAIHADAVVRTAGDRVYVVNRFLADNIEVLDPRRGFATTLQCSTGVRSNPHDIAVLEPRKAYVTRYGAPELWAVDPGAASCDGFVRRRIDLGALADADGIPEMDQMAVVGDRLFVTLARLDRGQRFAPAGHSRLAVIDTTTDTLAGVVELQGRNAFGDSAGLPREPETGRLVVAQAGNIMAVGDGGLELVDPFTLASAGWLVTEDDLGGNITDFVLLSARKGYAIVVDASLRNALVAFDPATRTVTRRLLSRDEYLPDIALAPDGTLWLADRTLLQPGIRIFDPAADDAALAPRAIDLGLPPFSLGFLP
jgi:DNA-binding beta-propeller fold protein YncE